ncbi:MAG: cupredoxin domain-containing protein [Myxococcales bacterium]
MIRTFAAIAALALLVPGAAFAKEPAAQKKESAPAAAEQPGEARHVKVLVTEKGFEPARIEAKPGESLVLDITRKTDQTCATNLMIPEQKVKLDLPLDEEVQVPVKVSKAGTIRFGCQMGMMIGGVIVAK